MKVLLRNPRREIEIDGPRRVHALLATLELNRESHLVMHPHWQSRAMPNC